MCVYKVQMYQRMASHIITLQSRDVASNKTKPEMVCLFLLMLPLLGLSAYSKADNVKVIPVVWKSTPNGKSILNCNISEKQDAPQTVSWKKDGQWIGNGMQWKINVKKPSDVGNFTCWNNATHELLNYITVYLWKIDNSYSTVEPNLMEDPDSKTYLTCRAKNYSGMFTCSWTLNLKDPLKMNFKILGSQGNITCEEPIEVKPRKYSVSCTRNNTCPVTEEYQQTELFLEAYYPKLYEKYYRSFFIKDILKPDTSECQLDSSGILTWTPPKTWNTPHTYFELTYQIKIVHNNRERVFCEIENSTELQHGGIFSCRNPEFHAGKCCIRSRDRYKKDSSWSEWSDPCRSTETISTTKSNVELCQCRRN